MRGWKTKTTLILVAALLSLAAVGHLLAAGTTGVFGTIKEMSAVTDKGVTVTLAVEDGTKQVDITPQTALTIPGNSAPTLKDLAIGQFLAITAEEVSGRLVARKVLVKPAEPVVATHLVGVVISKEGSRITVVNPDGESISVDLPVGFTEIEPGTTLTAIVKRDPATNELSLDDIQTAQQTIDRLQEQLLEAKPTKLGWKIQNLQNAIEASIARHLSILSDVAKRVPADARDTLNQVLQIQQAHYKRILEDLGLTTPGIEATGIISEISAKDKSFAIRLFPLQAGESIYLTVNDKTRVLVDDKDTTFDNLASKPENAVGLMVSVQYDATSYVARYVKVLKRELDITLLGKLLGEVGAGEIEGRVVQKNATATPPTVVISLTAGGNLTLVITKDTKIFVADQEASLGVLPLNAKVSVRYNAQTKEAIDISSISLRPNESPIAGVVSELTRKARSISIVTTDNKTLKLMLAENAVILRDGKRVPIQEIQLGDLVRSTTRYNTSTNEVTSLVLKSPETFNFQGVIVGTKSAPSGSPDENYLTIATTGSNLGLITVRVSGGTALERNGESAAFSDILIGDKVTKGVYRLNFSYDQLVREVTSLRLESPQILRVNGTVEAVDAKMGIVVVKPPTGALVVLRFSPTTKTEKDGNIDANIGMLEKDDTVIAATYKTATGEIIKLVVLSRNTLTTRGLILKVYSTTNEVVVGTAEQQVTLKITGNTKILKDGKETTLAKLAGRDIVAVAYYTMDGTALQIEVHTPNTITVSKGQGITPGR